jgi:hypothetical protein
MKLRRLRIENFKRFREPFTIEQFDDGLNLFAAPNESGKSTIAEAICAAFFQRHRSGSVESLRPWGDANATPTVELEFEIDGRRHRLTKAFLGRKRCSLVIDGQAPLDGVAAEDHLAALLGFRFPGKGASGPEHMGIPGLLWVRQSTAHQISDAVSHASDHLRRILGESFGELASSGGDALLREVESARNELLTRAEGNPRGELLAARQQAATLRATIEQLDRDIAAYRERVDRLATLRRAHLRDEQEQPWTVLHRQLQDARDALQRAETLEQRQRAERASLQRWTDYAASVRAQLEAFERDEAAVAARERAVEAAGAHEATARAGLEACELHHRHAVDVEAQARARLERARAAAEHAELSRSSLELQAGLDELAVTLERAREERARLTQLQSEAAVLVIAPADSKRLKHLSESLREINVRLDAVATVVEFDLVDGRALSFGGEALTGRTRRTVVNRTEIEIDGMGRISVSPGGGQLDQLAAQRDALSTELGALLQRMMVPNVAAAEARERQAEQRTRDAGASRKLLDVLAPKGVEALEAEQGARQARLVELRAALAALPAVAADDAALPGRAAAGAAAERAREALVDAAGAVNAARVAAAKAQSDLEAARQELAAAVATLNAPERAQRVAAARQALSDALTQQAAARQNTQSIDAEVGGVNFSLLRQDVERLERSARQLQDEHQHRSRLIATLEAELRTQGALGLEEQRADCVRECEAASRRAEELARRAAALDYLLGLLRDRRSALARRLRAPLQQHLDRYVQMLFPGARIEVAEDLSPGTITRVGPRGEESGEFDALSIGTREQMGIIARIAYADLLQAAGRPTLLILDDALVNSDEARLGHMKRVLYDAATRHQVLIFTWHPAAWRDLGVTSRSVLA